MGVLIQHQLNNYIVLPKNYIVGIKHLIYLFRGGRTQKKKSYGEVEKRTEEREEEK